MIRVRCSTSRGVIEDIIISGDFFMYPEDALWILQEKLRGIPVDRHVIEEVITKVIEDEGIELVGSRIEDFVEAVYNACIEG